MIPAPRRSLITMDPSKLSYFARAQAVRAGMASTYGALQGLGYPTGSGYQEELQRQREAADDAADAEEAEQLRREAADDAADAKAAAGGSLQTVDAFLAKLNRWVTPSTPIRPKGNFKPSPWPLVIGGAAVLAGGFLLYRVMKK